jgi:hydroxymethylbilane synthase
LLFQRPDLKVTEIRGNVPTRLSKFEAADLDGMVLAYAGLHRLGLGSGISHVIPTSEMLPAVGQGAIAIEIREDDDPIIAMTAKLNDDTTSTCIAAERSFLRQLEGGCQVPIGALATIENGSVRLEGMVCSLDGSTMLRDSITGKALEAYELGFRLASSLIEQGADKLLDEARHQSMASFEPIL